MISNILCWFDQRSCSGQNYRLNHTRRIENILLLLIFEGDLKCVDVRARRAYFIIELLTLHCNVKCNTARIGITLQYKDFGSVFDIGFIIM